MGARATSAPEHSSRIPMQPSTAAAVVLVPLVAWRLYSRVRRMVGRQRLSPRRHWVTVALFPSLAVLVGIGAASNPSAVEALAVGTAAGAALAIVGLRLTRFERTAEGWFYTPNAHIGIVVSVAFAARIAWRFVELGGLRGGFAAGPPPDLARSPLTLCLFGALAAYYAVYAGGLLRWRMSGRESAGPGPGGSS